jgi:hypothetical protein
LPTKKLSDLLNETACNIGKVLSGYSIAGIVIGITEAVDCLIKRVT